MSVHEERQKALADAIRHLSTVRINHGVDHHPDATSAQLLLADCIVIPEVQYKALIKIRDQQRPAMTGREKEFYRWALFHIRDHYCWHEANREVDQLDDGLARILVECGMLEVSTDTPIAKEFADINARMEHQDPFVVHRFTPAAIALIDGSDDDDEMQPEYELDYSKAMVGKHFEPIREACKVIKTMLQHNGAEREIAQR